jgi:hypothetical protein
MVAGVLLSGFDKDDGFTVEWNEDYWTREAGVDGEQTRNASNDFSGKITFKLKQNSKANAALQLQFLADSRSVIKTNATTIPVVIKSLVPGGSSFIALESWITKQPTATGGKMASVREWVFESSEIVGAETGL